MKKSVLLFFIFFTHTIVFLANEKNDTISIIGVGDIMLGTDYPTKSSLPPNNDCMPLLENVTEILKNASITFGNLEGTFAGEKGKPKSCKDTLNCYTFRMPEQYVSCLNAAGFDLLSVANNHSHDFGYEGKMNTVKVLQNAGIGFAGFVEYPTYILSRDGIKYGFCAFAPNTGTCNINNPDEAAETVKNLKKNCDIVIVSMHGGAEGAAHQNVTRKPEIFLGENRGNVYEFAHRMVDAGADIVFGHGPHVTRAIEIYNNRFIAYSLGNFCTYRKFNLKGPNGIAPIIKVNVNKNGTFLSGEIIPVCQIGEGITIIDPEKRAIKKIVELVNSDFPNSEIIISDDGKIQKKNPTNSK